MRGRGLCAAPQPFPLILLLLRSLSRITLSLAWQVFAGVAVLGTLAVFGLPLADVARVGLCVIVIDGCLLVTAHEDAKGSAPTCSPKASSSVAQLDLHERSVLRGGPGDFSPVRF